MTRETAYFAYLLRLARFGSGEEAVWRISLESPQTRERIVFTSLPELFRFLEGKSGALPEQTPGAVREPEAVETDFNE